MTSIKEASSGTGVGGQVAAPGFPPSARAKSAGFVAASIKYITTSAILANFSLTAKRKHNRPYHSQRTASYITDARGRCLRA